MRASVIVTNQGKSRLQ